MSKYGGGDQGAFDADRLVHYRLLAPEVYTPPRSHKRETEDRFLAVYDPQLETLDELDIIEVVEWGETP